MPATTTGALNALVILKIFLMVFANQISFLKTQQHKEFDRRKTAGELARCLPHVVIPIKVWVDDMAGVRSKRFSPFLNLRVVNCGLNI
jgi:hypothetical protein